MSSPSAAASKLRRPDHGSGDRALKILGDILMKEGLDEAVRSAIAGAPAREVTLPGFDLFTQGARSPFEWCVPKPRDEEHLINVYEEYVDRKLGKVDRPDTVARRLYANRVTARAYFGERRAASDWYVPAAKLVAASQHFDCTVERRGLTLTAFVSGYTLMVSPRGCHSNLRGASEAAQVVATDIGGAELSVPEISTRHPLAAALVQVEAPDCALWAANTLVREEAFHRIDTTTLFKPTARQALSAAKRLNRVEAVRIATLEATEVAEGQAIQPLVALYQAMVPQLCSAQYFKKHFGDPWRHPDRVPQPATRRAWMARIESLAREATHV
jgi:hypothetical protein